MKTSDFDYDLPPAAIAQEPLGERTASRLLLLDRTTGARQHWSFRDLPDLLEPGDLLVTNRSRVIPARLLGRRPGGGTAEILLVRRLRRDLWQALVRPGRRLRPGMVVRVAPGFRAKIEPSPPDAVAPNAAVSATRWVRLLTEDLEPDVAIDRYGHVPLPPYIRRTDGPADRERYQTVYAREAGSVAAPTAGLHFTPALLQRLREGGVETTEIVLHVGPGTFRPVEVDDIRHHHVDPEMFTIPAAAATAIGEARSQGRRIIAVGTTTTRALEAAVIPDGGLKPGEGETSLVILPGHRFQVVDALITNFHLPRSSLLLLVSAFAGRETVLAAYAEAVREGYRFYSYGDAMLIT